MIFITPATGIYWVFFPHHTYRNLHKPAARCDPKSKTGDTYMYCSLRKCLISFLVVDWIAFRNAISTDDGCIGYMYIYLLHNLSIGDGGGGNGISWEVKDILCSHFIHSTLFKDPLRSPQSNDGSLCHVSRLRERVHRPAGPTLPRLTSGLSRLWTTSNVRALRHSNFNAGWCDSWNSNGTRKWRSRSDQRPGWISSCLRRTSPPQTTLPWWCSPSKPSSNIIMWMMPSERCCNLVHVQLSCYNANPSRPLPKNVTLGRIRWESCCHIPLHYLLLEKTDGSPDALVMTSGKLSEEPIATDKNEARERLASLADAFLMHDRDIYIRCDDSVVRVHESEIYPIPCSRGYFPFPVKLPWEVSQSLAVEPELKNTFCITNKNYAFLSRHIRDMEN